jgi:hypothetical protein
MKKRMSIVMFGFLALLNGCNDPLSGMKDDLQKAAGISVALLAPDSDACATQQIRALIDEFNSLDAKDQAALREKLARYSAIEIRATLASETISGERTELVLGREESYVENVCQPKPGSFSTCNPAIPDDTKGCSCKDVSRTRFVEKARKQIADSIASSGSAPATQIVRGDRLVIQTQEAQNEAREGAYRTLSPAVYQDVQKAGDAAFMQAMRYQAISDFTSTYHALQCGKLASLRDLTEAQ